MLVLRQHFIICTCPSLTSCFWQAVSVKTGMSGMSVPLAQILSVASGDKEIDRKINV